MRAFLLLSALVFAANQAEAKKLSDYRFYEHDVRFTNPVCKDYMYRGTVRSNSGAILTQKPKNVYCSKADEGPSAKRPTSVQYKLLEWIKAPTTKEIFFTYLSFSNETVLNELCSAVEKRNVKVRFIIDSGDPKKTAAEREKGYVAAKALAACKPKSRDPKDSPEFILRGHSKGINWAHNKIFIVNPSSQDKIQILFSSGNMSPGVVLHHENWHFITTDVKSHFAQAHLCAMNGMLSHYKSAQEFAKFMTGCRAAIDAPEESDIKSFFVPGDGVQATKAIASALRSAKQVSIAAHRFSYSELRELLTRKLSTDKRVNMRFVADDDLYWVGTTGESKGPNMQAEYTKTVAPLTKLGLKPRWLETNHMGRFLHHNKFIVFDKSAVFAGAGNFTGDAFEGNFENFYFITTPAVVDAFYEQYEHLWQMATPVENMPTQDIPL